MKVTFGSMWYDEDERAEKIAEFKSKYNLDATFHDGSDYSSSWTVEGDEEDIKRYLIDCEFHLVINLMLDKFKAMSLEEIVKAIEAPDADLAGVIEICASSN